MELNRVVCTTCGSTLEASVSDTVLICDACGNTFLVTNGKDFAEKSEEERGSIKKLRNNLERSTVADDHKNILHFSKEILRLIPKDYLANYYYAYANYAFGSRRYLFDFYSQTLTNLPEEADIIIDHVTINGDVRDKALIETFIARNNPDKLDNYRQKYLQKLIDEENYSLIPRDVFISFRSTEISIATEVLGVLERDGNTCWISSRNLRPNDSENYWSNIEDAIKKCKVFLVMSSHDAMISRDVKKELDIATKLNKQRIEFKIDTARHTSFFKYFFDGWKWIDATTDKFEAFTTLKRRVYEFINSEVQKESISKSKMKSSETDDYSRKINRSKVELLSANYTGAVNSIKDALGINPESSEAWWMLFLAENEFQNTEKFVEYISRNQSLSKLSDFYNKVAYNQFKKHARTQNGRLPENIVKFEKTLYEDILAYLNQKNLPEKSKRDFLNSYCPTHILTVWGNMFLPKGFKYDDLISDMIDNPSKIKELENIFENFDDLKNHSQYETSHLKEYHERFYHNHAMTLKQRESNLKELNQGIDALYKSIEELISNGKYKESLKKSLELFYFDNSSYDKYLYVFLSKIKAKNTCDAYDVFFKLRKKDRELLINSIVFQKLFISEKYHDLMNDLILHAFYKKRKKHNRIELVLRGEEDGM